MANNRIFIVNTEYKKAVYLGKRMLSGYYDVPDDIKTRIENLFEQCEFGDDFKILFESDVKLSAPSETGVYDIK